ncbi:MAG: hypothetical protein A3A26_02490 [Candidatus Zambryskibacteria bacterium RIFCSPLOWO2_01_FULL_47_14]|nr:MAG: hypothetical protein A3A26_02490 [Candidatus Zambryskibacteria bacterium RIFCSPLOWO2_01_FULL_47_14]
MQFLDRLIGAAEELRKVGCNTDVRVCADQFGLLVPDASDDDRVLMAIKKLAAPGILHRRRFTLDEWLRFDELWLYLVERKNGAGH